MNERKKTPVSFKLFKLKHTKVPLSLSSTVSPSLSYNGKRTSGNRLFFLHSNVKHVAWCGQILAWHVKKVQRSAFNHTGMDTETTHWGKTSKWALADFITWENATHLTYRDVSAHARQVLNVTWEHTQGFNVDPHTLNILHWANSVHVTYELITALHIGCRL